MQITVDRPAEPQSSINRPLAVSSPVTVRIWGARGGIACPGPQTARYGGNTSCVEVDVGGRLVIFDAGTGIRRLGEALAARGGTVRGDIFFSHFHIDHICGLPFFAPCYLPTSELRFWGASTPGHRTTKEALGAMMADPLFPVGLNEFKAKIEYRDFGVGEKLRPFEGAKLRTMALTHPGGATGYRLEIGNKVIAYVTDTEHRPGTLDLNVLDLIEGADLMIYDANYTDEEFAKFVGWGHSTWQQGVRLADAADVKTLLLFHHDPGRNDESLDRIECEANRVRPGTIVGREDLEIQIGHRSINEWSGRLEVHSSGMLMQLREGMRGASRSS